MSECNVEIIVPDECRRLDQNEEWVEIVTEQGIQKAHLHDYGLFYEIPGLYDSFYKGLKCQSPRVVCDALKTKMLEHRRDQKPLRVLDFGAGSGQVGEQMARELDCESVVGLDIIPQAREAAERERPEVYDEYYVLNMAEPTDEELMELAKWDFNTLVTVAALGFGDICTKAFLNAYNLLNKGAWVAFNIKDRFLSEQDETGFADTINSLMDNGFNMVESKRYRHRLSLAGKPLHYYVIIGQKTRDITIN